MRAASAVVQNSIIVPISKKIFKGYGIELRPITPKDLPSLRRWRNSSRIKEQMMDQSYISPAQQRLWYERIRAKPDQAHWVVWCKGVRTGYMNIKGNGSLESQKQLDVGMYVGDSPVRHGLLGYAIAMMQIEIAFNVLSAAQIRMSVKENNHGALRFNQQLGYREEGCQNGLVYWSITPSDYQEAKTRLRRYFGDDGIVAA
jgi:RimJ/RimL family protein N-acetyltransferase